MKKLLGTIVLGLLSMSVLADQTGDCTAGEQYCEQNRLDTTNTTTTTNTNTNTQTITRPNGANQSSLWTSGVGNIDIGLQTTGTIRVGSGPMLKLTSSTSVLKSALKNQAGTAVWDGGNNNYDNNRSIQGAPAEVLFNKFGKVENCIEYSGTLDIPLTITF